MKKYFFIAVAAVAAMAACSKVETVDTTPDKKIAFEVANYAAQTKANQSLTNAEDGIYEFHTVAYQFPTIGSPRTFMDVDILPWSDETTPVQVTATNDDSKTIGSWAPAEDYFWPKTGYINFYSYAGSHDPAVDVNDGTDEDWKTVTFTYDDAVITATSNILVADAALHYGRTNSATETHQVDDSETAGHVTKGVPTLFRHQLAKIKFDVRAKTTSDKVSANTVWKIQVLGTQDYGTPATTIKSAITPINTGDLVLTNVDDKTSADTKVWSKVTTGAVSGWVPGTDTEEIVFTATADIASAPDVLTIPVNQIQSLDSSNQPLDPIVLLDYRSAMPQLTENVPFTLVYKVQALHGTTVYLEEIRTVGVPAIDLGTTKSLEDLVSTLTSWEANKKITYHIIIDPVSEKVTFDPAVEEYDPEEYTGYINEGGITTQF